MAQEPPNDPPPNDPNTPGQILRDKYRIERVLGSGGMGIVLLATHLRLGQRVAIKRLAPESQARADVVERFAREARAASRLRSEHAVRILDVDDSDAGEPFLVMEFLEGNDLQHVLAETAQTAETGSGGLSSIALAIDYLLQVCEGLAEAHAAGIVHRDLKPANLFLTKRADGSALVKLLDFGISKDILIEEENASAFGITRPDTALGSPSYMSPEQIKNAGKVDATCDVWALGVILYQLLTNELPFTATTSAALAARIAADPPRPIRELRRDVPEEIDRAIARCLEKDPRARFADVGALAHVLAPFGSAGSTSAADRIERVVSVARERRLQVTPIGPQTPLPPPAGALTASVAASASPLPPENVTQPPLLSSVTREPHGTTDDASSVTREPPVITPETPSRKPRALMIATVAALAVILVVGAVVIPRFFRHHPAPVTSTASSPPQTSSSDAPPLATSVATVPTTPRSSSSASMAPPTSSASATKPVISAKPAARPPPPRATATATTKNPMDLDFR